MDLQPYKVKIVNKTPEQLGNILQHITEQDVKPLTKLFLPNFEIDQLTEIFMANPESINQLIKYYQKLGIEVNYSIKQGHNYLVNNQQYINSKGTVEFICTAIQYLVDNCSEDEIYSKISQGDLDLSFADHYILETNIN